MPLDRKDKFKLGLVVEGGGMRGAVSAGGLLELGNLGFRQASAVPLQLLLNRWKQVAYLLHALLAS